MRREVGQVWLIDLDSGEVRLNCYGGGGGGGGGIIRQVVLIVSNYDDDVG